MSGYFGGAVLFDKGEEDALVSVLNLVASKDVPLVVGNVEETGPSRSLPIAFKCRDDGLAGLCDEGVTLAELERLFEGSRLNVVKLNPCVGNAGHVRLVHEIEQAATRRHFKRADVETGPKAAPDSPAAAFGNLVGLDRQIATVREIVAAGVSYGRSAVCTNLVLLGNPGTGKSTFAAALGRHARESGLVDGPFCQVDAEQLIAAYVGQTGRLVRDAWERARGGILFIDEAYRIAETASYGCEAINALNELMEQDRDETMVVVAGYVNEMRLFLDANPGLRSRFACTITFPDYDAAMLERIFMQGFVRRLGLSVEDGFEARLTEVCRSLPRTEGFANARTVRRLFERCLMKQAAYCGGGRVLSVQALDSAMADLDIKGADRKIGF